MSLITRFEEIEGWQKARELTHAIYQITSQGGFARDFSLKDKIRRSGVSSMANIAEGFEREGNKEFVQFLAQSKGSAAEVKSHLYVALDARFISDSQFKNTYQLADESEASSDTWNRPRIPDANSAARKPPGKLKTRNPKLET